MLSHQDRPTARQDTNTSAILPDRNRVLMMTVRQILIMALGAVEDWLEIERSITPRRKR